MKYVCDDPRLGSRSTWYRCVKTLEYYKDTTSNKLSGSICSDDPHFYQACGTNQGGKVTNSKFLCEHYLCKYNQDELKIVPSGQMAFKGKCGQGCVNTDLNEEGCDEAVVLPSGKWVEAGQICDDFCNIWICEDEAFCNGNYYGIYCKRNGNLDYVPQEKICDGNIYCDDGKDEKDCQANKDDEPFCRHEKKGNIVPVHNFTRCAVVDKSDYFSRGRENKYCKFQDIALYQTNCTDPLKVGVSCNIAGYPSTVSKYLICFDDKISACDDKIDSNCLSTRSCHVHKHAMCDNKIDCVDQADENHPDCRSKVKATCTRRVGKGGELQIPISWLKDGVWDCENGVDEIGHWPTCGQGKTQRFVSSNETKCENVFLCRTVNHGHGYVELSSLCDGLETCGNENAICSVSGRSQGVTTSVLTANKGLNKHFSYCLKGLEQLEHLMKTCVQEQFIFPDGDIFRVDTKTSLIFPNTTTTCDNIYGELYLYLSCTERCVNTTCPLRTIPRYEVCPNQFPDRIGTIVDNEYLIFLTRSFGNVYTNRYFVCDDKITCIDYSRVCDLVYDCKDRSDETMCSNHFMCNASEKLLPKTRKCDENIDCFDLSDECNEKCSKDILEGIFLKGISWLIGILAVVANAVIIGKSLWTIKRCKTAPAVMNRCLIIMIALGDFFIGCYLLIIAVYDTIVFKNNYCKNHISWITSVECSMIGIFSTIGSQISLFSMTGLSIVRIHGIWNSMRISGEVTLAQILKITATMIFLMLASTAIAVIPVMTIFEDFFVNGVKFSDGLKIFIGMPNKDTVLQVIEAYYGRTKEATLRWRTLIEMVQDMFSHDLDYEDLTKTVGKVEFYGNDGVCLFKYFVQPQDPQRLFVWGILSLNFVCFIFISLSYLLIGILSQRSSKKLAGSQNNQQIAKRNNRMNQRIAFIITTDFVCWIPFIIICILHSLNVIDATAWYSIFSMVILPINSVINPLLYDDTVTSHIGAATRLFKNRISSSALLQSLRDRTTPESALSTELDDFKAQDAKGSKDIEKDVKLNKNKGDKDCECDYTTNVKIE